MSTAAQSLAKFATELKYSDIPPAVVERAKACIIDTVAVATFGSQFSWSGIVADYAKRYGKGGVSSLLGISDVRVHAPYAALANASFAHAFEQDSTHEPNVGAHPGTTLLPAVLALAEETKVDGKTAITAFVAACEVLFRIARTSHRSQTPPEVMGFHALGLTGPYGVAVAAGLVLGLNTEQLTHALGIAGSLSSGLLAFTKAKQGGMVKRLHLGRAAESGILAARLAASGYTGPETVLDGKFGFLEVYCRGADVSKMTEGLHEDWEVLRICMKRYACHMTAQTPVQSMRTLIETHKFRGEDVEKIVVEGIEKLVSHNNIVEPGDVAQGQYSVPFCVALAMFKDPDDPKSFSIEALNDPQIRAACRRVEMKARPLGNRNEKETRTTVYLKDGREFAHDGNTFKGMLADPLTREDLRKKFMTLTASILGEARAKQQFEHLDQLETQPHFHLA